MLINETTVSANGLHCDYQRQRLLRQGILNINGKIMQTELPEIFSSTLGLSHPWKITTLSFAKEEKRLDISVDFLDNGFLLCPSCGAEGISCQMKTEIWYHHDFFRYATYLHACVPHSECCGTVIPVERPWSRDGSRFALLN